MAYATYDAFGLGEPMQTNQAQMSGGAWPNQLTGPNGQMPANVAARPPVAQSQESKAVPLQPVPSGPSTWKDISEYEEIQDWFYIIVAVLIVEVFVIFLTRFYPDLLGKTLNIWYNRFKLSAVLADVLIILIGFAIARYVYSEYVYPTKDWNPLYFTGTAVGVQLIHDLLFYFGVIKTIPTGNNAMMDVFKTYAESGGAKILAADSAMMIGSSVLAMLLKAAQPHVVVATALVTAYILPYILETRNEFSSIV